MSSYNFHLAEVLAWYLLKKNENLKTRAGLEATVASFGKNIMREVKQTVELNDIFKAKCEVLLGNSLSPRSINSLKHASLHELNKNGHNSMAARAPSFFFPSELLFKRYHANPEKSSANLRMYFLETTLPKQKTYTG